MFYQTLPVIFNFIADNPGTDYSITIDLTQTLLTFARTN